MKWMLLFGLLAAPAMAGAPPVMPGDTVTLARVFICDTPAHVAAIANANKDPQTAANVLAAGDCIGPPTNEMFVVDSFKDVDGYAMVRVHAKGSSMLWWTIYNALIPL
jgi:hypothetical protein